MHPPNLTPKRRLDWFKAKREVILNWLYFKPNYERKYWLLTLKPPMITIEAFQLDPRFWNSGYLSWFELPDINPRNILTLMQCRGTTRRNLSIDLFKALNPTAKELNEFNAWHITGDSTMSHSTQNEAVILHNATCEITNRLPCAALVSPTFDQMIRYNMSAHPTTRQFKPAEIASAKGSELTTSESNDVNKYCRADTPVATNDVNAQIIYGNVYAKSIDDLRPLDTQHPYTNYQVLLNNALVPDALRIPEFLLKNVATDAECKTIYRPDFTRKEALSEYQSRINHQDVNK